MIKNGKIWPYTIAILVTMVFSFCVATVIITINSNIDESNLYMENYHQVNDDANKIIENEIAFKKKYNLKYINNGLHVENTTISYKLTDKNNNPINNAKIELLITRPIDTKLDMRFDKPSVNNGVYVFDKIKLPKQGRWDIIAKVTIGKLSMYKSIKADTRYKIIQEF